MGFLPTIALAGEVRSGLGNRTDITDAQISTALNFAQSRIARFYDFSELAQVATATMIFQNQPILDKFVELPAAPLPLVKDIHSFVLQDGADSRKLIEKPWRFFDKVFPLPEFDAQDWPSIYTRWGSLVTVWPSPLKAFPLVLRYTSWPTVLDVGNLPNAFSDFDNKDDILVEFSISYIFRLKGRDALAMSHRALGQEMLNEAIERENLRPDMDTTNSLPQDTFPGQYWASPFVQGVNS